MIFPVLRGFLPLHLVPATWLLFALNILVFVFTLPKFTVAQTDMDRFFTDMAFMRTQGYVFAQFVSQRPNEHSLLLQQLAKKASAGHEESQIMMGGYAIRDRDFMESAADFDVKGDAIALKQWRSDFIDLRDVQARHPNYKWGLSAQRSGAANWISYQFAHSGFQHIAWNMLFFLLFAGFLESQVGSSLVVLVYLGSGLAGAGVFAILAGLSFSPLIGASGAVSGFMACVAALCWKEGVRFFYFLVPVQGYVGFRDLPAWLIAVSFLIPDLAGQIASVADVNGMAYSAHIGGALFGGLAGVAIRQGWIERETTPTAEEGIW